MSTLLEKALEKVVVFPQDEQDAIASQILASLADEEAWKKRFIEKRDVIRRMAREALAEDERGETVPLDDSALIQSLTTRRLWRLFFRTTSGHSTGREARIANSRAIPRTPVFNLKNSKARIASIPFASVSTFVRLGQ